MSHAWGKYGVPQGKSQCSQLSAGLSVCRVMVIPGTDTLLLSRLCKWLVTPLLHHSNSAKPSSTRSSYPSVILPLTHVHSFRVFNKLLFSNSASASQLPLAYHLTLWCAVWYWFLMVSLSLINFNSTPSTAIHSLSSLPYIIMNHSSTPQLVTFHPLAHSTCCTLSTKIHYKKILFGYVSSTSPSIIKYTSIKPTP